MKFIWIGLIILLSFEIDAKIAGKCSDYVKLAALDSAKEILGIDIERSSIDIGSLPFTVDIGTPILHDKEKNPPGVFEAYQLDLILKVKGNSGQHSIRYFFNENCFRMIDAEIKAGKEIETKLKKN